MKFIYSIPFLSSARANPSNGIHQVIVAMGKHLPAFGYQLAENPDNVDLHVHHAGEGNGKLDVSICHGLHPTQVEGVSPAPYQYEVNARVIRDAIGAKALIVPSEWVADLFRRDMLLNPDVIHWGIDIDTWTHDDPHEGYVLWNKGRIDPVCSPDPLNQTAARLPNRPFVATFGDNNLPNLRLTGRIKHEDMQRLVKRAAVYLATTKETGDIGSREALAAGVPVVAFRQGATPDFVQHGVNGYLAEPGDIDGLTRGIEYCFRHRAVLSANARHLAAAYNWKTSIEHMARVFDRTLTSTPSPIVVSVVIPTYNYEQYVLEAIQSVLMQRTRFPFEIIVVNDGSTDGTQQVLDALQGRWPQDAPPLRIIHQANQGVATARNVGIQAAQGRYVMCLDADDTIADGFIEACASALEQDTHLGIAFTRLQFMGGGSTNWLSQPISYDAYVEGFNQVPTCCVFRRDDALRVGGFRQYMKPAEDADLWLRLLTFTGKRAECVSQTPLFLYRLHGESVTAQHRAAGKIDPFLVRAKEKQPTWGYKRPFAAPVPAKETKKSNPVKNYDRPIVCFILSEQGDWQLTVDAIEGQTFPFWTLRADDALPIPAYRHLQYQDAPIRVNVKAGTWLSPDWLERQLEQLGDLPPYESERFLVLMAGCCGGSKLVSKSSAVYSNDDFVLVEYQNSVAGKVQVRGKVTRIDYHKRKFGEQFLMHKNDAAADPALFKVVPPVANVSVEIQTRTTDPAPPELLEATPPPEEPPPVAEIEPKSKSVKSKRERPTADTRSVAS